MRVNLCRGTYMLRSPEPEDLECMYRFENAPALWAVSGTTGPYSRFHLRQYMEQTQNDLFADRQLRLMIEDTARQAVAGIIDLCNFDPLHSRAEVGIVVDIPYRNRGVGRTALQLLEDHCFHRLSIHQLYAYVATDNEPCHRLFSSCGFRSGAVLADWIRIDNRYGDVWLMQKINPAR